MEDRDTPVQIDTDNARGGSSPNIVRWVLGISLLAAIIAMSAIWMTGAWNSPGGYSGGAADATGTQREAQSSRAITEQTEAQRAEALQDEGVVEAEGDPAMDPAHSAPQR